MARRGNIFRVSGRSASRDVWPSDFECIESPGVQLNWYVGPTATYGLERQPLTIMRSPLAEPSQEGKLLYSCATPHLDPLFQQRWRDAKVIRRYDPAQIAGKRLIERIERPDDTQRIFHSELYHNEKLEVRERVTFSTKYKPAVLLKQESYIDRRQAGSKCATEFLPEAERFVQVSGGWLPARTMRVSGPVEVKDKTEPKWMADEWVSEDLGKRPPMPEDFVLIIPEHVEVRGLKDTPSVGTVRRLDMNTLTLQNVDAPQEGIDVDRRPFTAPVSSSKPLRPALVILGIIALGLTGGLIWRARARKRVR